jgi:hypothetical protein
MRRLPLCIAAVVLASAGANAAYSKDTEPCVTGMVCASDPQTIVNALQEEGYKAKLGTDAEGDPIVTSAASGYDFDILFYDCENHEQCASIQFRVSFSKDADNTPELANKWNLDSRVIQLAATSDQQLRGNYDVTTIGGINKRNFADILTWWQDTLGELRKFFEKTAPPAKK